MTLEPGHKLYIYSRNNVHAGVGILVHARLAKMIRRIYRKSDRVLGMDLMFHNKLIKLVAVYCPTTNYPISCLEQVYLDLQNLVEDTLRNRGHCIIGGDFNTVFDHEERGQLLAEFLANFNLDLANHPD